MLYKTKGIVLGFIKYSDTSIIVRIYTESFGLQSYIVNGVRSKSSKNKIALFQPLTLLDMVVYHKQGRDLHRLSEIKCNAIFSHIPYEQKKISIAIFITEILSKTLKEDHPHPELFDYLATFIKYLDEVNKDYENIHLQFLVKFSSYLGFMPSSAEQILIEIRKDFNDQNKSMLERLIVSKISEPIKLLNSERRIVLEYLLDFYSYHVENFGTVNSVSVLKEILE